MIGAVAWGNARFLATLDDDHTWTVDGMPREAAAGMARLLAAVYADRPTGPAHGPYGPAILHDLAGLVGGTVDLERKRRPPPGTVY